MTKFITTISFTLLTTFLFGQNKEVENFINQAYLQIVPSNFKYYNLIDSSFVTEFDKYSLSRDELKNLLQNNPDFPYDNFIQKGKNFVLLSWTNYKLTKAKIYSNTAVPKFSSQIRVNRLVPFNTSEQLLDSLEMTKKYIEVIVPVKNSWGDKRRNKEIKKAWAKYSNSIRTEDKVYFKFSTPIFSDNGLYSIVTLNRSDRGATYVFKKVDNKWNEIILIRRWVN
jgi:hypothetical protein